MKRTYGIRLATWMLGVGLVAIAVAGCGSDAAGPVVEPGDTSSDADLPGGGDATGDVGLDALGDGHGKPDNSSDTLPDAGDDLLPDAQPDAEVVQSQCLPACDTQQHRVCDLQTLTCVCEDKYCDIEGQCVEDGEVAATGCQVCDVAANATQWTLRKANDICRPSLGGCDPAEMCDGKSGECPLDVVNTGSCDDGNDCTKDDTCNASKVCVGVPYSCEAPTECQESHYCDGLGGCKAVNKADSTVCGNSGNACAENQCQAGECVVVGVSEGCFIDGLCQSEGTIQAAVGDAGCRVCDSGLAWDAWSIRALAPCDDGNLCTLSDTCSEAGVCAGTVYPCTIHGICDGVGGCECGDGYAGDACDQCAQGFGGYPDCIPCDLDNDGYLAMDALCLGDDCNDNDPLINPGIVDLPDPAFLDANCDGYDGMIQDAILVAFYGEDSVHCGDQDAPCLTVPVARFRTMLTGKRQIWLQAGTYEEGPGQLGPVDAGLGIFGGYDSHWERGDGTSEDFAYATTVETSNEFLIDIYNTSDITIGNLKLVGAHAEGIQPGTRSGRSSYVVRTMNATARFENVLVVQGNGAAGLAGADSSQGSSGSVGTNGGEPIWWVTCPGFAAGGGAGGASSCNPGGGGGTGGDVYCGFMGIHLFNNGANGGGTCGDASCQWGASGGTAGVAGDTVGKNGGGGQNGQNGAGGSGGEGGLVDSYGYFTSSAGASGGNGTNGVGGGGGGGGSGRSDWVVVAVSYAGGSGGGGGGGGCAPTNQAGGGGGGGSSVGFLLLNSNVDVSNVTFQLGNGAPGATGGKGALGGTGAAGGSGVPRGDGHGAIGGNGGKGGDGGASGGGGGGAGGHSVAILQAGSNVAVENLMVEGGTAGAGGSGGTLAGTTSGAQGQAGSVAQVLEATMPNSLQIPGGGQLQPTCNPFVQDCLCGEGLYEIDGTCLTRGFVKIGSGTFNMGSPANELGRSAATSFATDPESQHTVELTYVIEMQMNEVTQLEWAAAFENDPSIFGPDYSMQGIVFPMCGSTCPVNYVTFSEAAAYANWLSLQHGLEPCYLLSDCTGQIGIRDTSGGLPTGYTCSIAFNDVLIPQACEGYRLPTEAEWEWAARAGTTTATYVGNLASDTTDLALNQVAWTTSNTSSLLIPGSPTGFHYIKPTFQRRPNPWGLYDMLGNVAEWTNDFMSAYGGFVVDPVVLAPPDSNMPAMVARGGTSNNSSKHCRSASRLLGVANMGVAMPDATFSSTEMGVTGFRLVRTLYRELP